MYSLLSSSLLFSPTSLKHTGERPFTCHCSKQFSRLDSLRQHAQTVHADKTNLNEAMMRELTSLHTSMGGTPSATAPSTTAAAVGPAMTSPTTPTLASGGAGKREGAATKRTRGGGSAAGVAAMGSPYVLLTPINTSGPPPSRAPSPVHTDIVFLRRLHRLLARRLAAAAALAEPPRPTGHSRAPCRLPHAIPRPALHACAASTRTSGCARHLDAGNPLSSRASISVSPSPNPHSGRVSPSPYPASPVGERGPGARGAREGAALPRPVLDPDPRDARRHAPPSSSSASALCLILAGRSALRGRQASAFNNEYILHVLRKCAAGNGVRDAIRVELDLEMMTQGGPLHSTTQCCTEGTPHYRTTALQSTAVVLRSAAQQPQVLLDISLYWVSTGTNQKKKSKREEGRRDIYNYKIYCCGRKDPRNEGSLQGQFRNARLHWATINFECGNGRILVPVYIGGSLRVCRVGTEKWTNEEGEWIWGGMIRDTERCYRLATRDREGWRRWSLYKNLAGTIHICSAARINSVARAGFPRLCTFQSRGSPAEPSRILSNSDLRDYGHDRQLEKAETSQPQIAERLWTSGRGGVLQPPTSPHIQPFL
ncbi:hypothetical protein DFH09DRAFT_1079517 [Mycena vulgaris]|nr:hypothetical protein DFH09DRAFT_1079517 [Mycena vulgaris]